MAKNRACYILGVAFLMALPSSQVLAQDSVKVRFNPAYPAPNQTSEFTQISVSRISAAEPGRETDVDRYFTKIQRTLSNARAPAKWGSVIVDAASVDVEIEIGKAHFSFFNTFGSNGFVLPSPPSANDTRVAAAVQDVITLTLEQTQRRLAPK